MQVIKIATKSLKLSCFALALAGAGTLVNAQTSTGTKSQIESATTQHCAPGQKSDDKGNCDQTPGSSASKAGVQGISTPGHPEGTKSQIDDALTKHCAPGQKPDSKGNCDQTPGNSASKAGMTPTGANAPLGHPEGTKSQIDDALTKHCAPGQKADANGRCGTANK